MSDYISDSANQSDRRPQVYSRKKIYARLRRMKAEDNPRNLLFSFYSEILNCESTGAIMERFRSMTESILESGTAIPVPESQLANRKSVGLPEIRFDVEELKRLARKMQAVRQG